MRIGSEAYYRKLEQQLIGRMLLHPSTCIEPVLHFDPDALRDPINRSIFVAVRARFIGMQPVNAQHVADDLRDDLAAVGGVSYLAQIVEAARRGN